MIDKSRILYNAAFSEDKKHRYFLSRIWDSLKPLCCFVMLNPSIADDTIDDPTIRRCMNFADSWGYGGIYVVNIYSCITPYPKLINMDAINKADNNYSLQKAFDKCCIIIFAWGNYKIDNYVKHNIINYLRLKNIKPMCIKQNKNGSPAHPLYLKADLKPIEYKHGKEY